MAEFVYAALLRPPGYATIPDGYTGFDRGDSRGPHGTVTYPEPLKRSDAERFDLRLLEAPMGVYDIFGLNQSAQEEYLFRFTGTAITAFAIAKRDAAEFGRVYADYRAELVEEL